MNTEEIPPPPCGEVVRTVELDTPSHLYTAAEQTADHGAPVTTFPVRVAQLSATAGAGLMLEETVHA